jgi:hypothetical protein
MLRLRFLGEIIVINQVLVSLCLFFRVDQIIMAKPAGGPKPKGPSGDDGP